MNRIATAPDRISRSSAVIAGVALISMMAAICADVILRRTLGHGFPESVEYSEILLVVMVFLGWPEAQRAGAHIAVDLFTARLPENAQRIIAAGGLVLVLLVLIPITWHTGVDALESLQSGEFRIGIANTPVWPARAAVAIGLLATVLQCGAQLFQLLERRNVDRILSAPVHAL